MPSRRAWVGFLLLAACSRPGDRPVAGTQSVLPARGCLAAALRPPLTAPGADVVRVGLRRALEAGRAGRFELRPVVLEGHGSGRALLTLEGPFAVFGDDGEPLPLPLEVGDGDLPLTLLLGAEAYGSGALRVEPLDPPDETCAGATLGLETLLSHELAARSLDRFPHARHVDLFRDDEIVQIAVDRSVLADRVGLPFDVYVVKHRTPAQWAEDDRLFNIADVVERGVVGLDPTDGVTAVWSGDPRAGRDGLAAYDVVLDFGSDGRLDPGDLIDGFGASPGFWIAGDLSAPGPWRPVASSVSDEPDIALELWLPEDLTEPRSAPLVVISHGNGHDYRWYGHLGRHLASWGFVVASHRTAAAPGVTAAGRSTLRATSYVLSQRDTLAGGLLGRVLDPDRIAWVGHSRGGEGILLAWQQLLEDVAPAPGSGLDAGSLRALVSIAPTVFEGVDRSNPDHAPFLLIAGAADGDVTGGVDCGLCQYLRIPAAASGPVATLYVHGASHSVFHDGAPWIEDDGVGPDRVGRDLVHPAEQAWLLAWLSWQVRGEPAFREVFTLAAAGEPPRGVSQRLVVAGTWREDVGDDLLVVDDFQHGFAPHTTSAGGLASWAGMDVVEGLLDDSDRDLNPREHDVMNGMTRVEGDGYERGVVLTWSGDAHFTAALPAPTDVRRWRELSVMAAQATRHPFTAARSAPLAFGIELVDADGNASLIDAGAFGVVPAPYAREGLGSGVGWANEWVTIRVPVRAFVVDERRIDLARIVAVTLRFGERWGASVGRLGIDDLLFAP